MNLKVISFRFAFILMNLNVIFSQQQCPTIPNSVTTAGLVMFPSRLPDRDHYDRVVSYDGRAQHNCTYDTECARRISCIGMEVPCCASGSCQCLYGVNFRCPPLKLAAIARSGFCNKYESDYVYNSLAIYRGSSDSDNQPLTITASPASEATGGYAILEAYGSTSLPESYQYHVSWYMQFNLSPRTTSSVTGVLRSMLKVMKSRDIMDAIEPRVLDEIFQLRNENRTGSSSGVGPTPSENPSVENPLAPLSNPIPKKPASTSASVADAKEESKSIPEPETNQLIPPNPNKSIKLPIPVPEETSATTTV